MRIRKYRIEDAPELVELYQRSVRSIGPRDYSPEQVAAWASLAPSVEAMHARCGDGHIVLLAVDGQDRPLAFGDLEPDGHIGYFYCTPEHVGSGVALAVYSSLEQYALSADLPRM